MCDLVTKGKGSSVRGSVMLSGDADASKIFVFAIGIAGKRVGYPKRNAAESTLYCSASVRRSPNSPRRLRDRGAARA